MRSREELSKYERSIAENAFTLFDIDHAGKLLDVDIFLSLDSIQIEELKALLLHCNLQLEEEAYEDYLAKYYELQRPQTVEKEDFLNVF